jgi:hypothetical protein
LLLNSSMVRQVVARSAFPAIGIEGKRDRDRSAGFTVRRLK